MRPASTSPASLDTPLVAPLEEPLDAPLVAPLEEPLEEPLELPLDEPLVVPEPLLVAPLEVPLSLLPLEPALPLLSPEEPPEPLVLLLQRATPTSTSDRARPCDKNNNPRRDRRLRFMMTIFSGSSGNAPRGLERSTQKANGIALRSFG